MNEIQRKLELFEKRLAGRWAIHREVVSTSPLFFAAAGLIFGICLQRYINIQYWVWLILLLVFFACAALYFVYYSWASGRVISRNVLAYFSVFCALCLGGVRLSQYNAATPNDIRNFVGSERILATIRGRIVTEPYTKYEDNWAFARYSHSDPSSSFYLQLVQADAVDGWKDVSGTIRVNVDEPTLDLKVGDSIEAYCSLSRFRGATNPGQFDLADYMANRNVYVGASVKSREGIKLLGREKESSWTGLESRFRRIVSGALLDDEAVEQSEKGLVEALLLGYRGHIDADTYRAFEKTGLLHFISLSGLHLGIFVAMFWWVTARFGLLKPARAVVCIGLLVLFLIVVPPRAPTVRAAVIAFVFLLSIFFRRHPNSLNTLSIAAIILLLAGPTSLFEAGWQLSFATVLGILMFCKRFYFFLDAKLFPESLLEKHKRFSLLQKITRPVLGLFTTGLAAWIGGAGILLHHFYAINPLASIYTVAAFPLVAAILGVGFLKILMSFLLPSISALLGLALGFLSTALIGLVKFFARFDLSEILIGQVPVAVVFLYYSGIAVIVWAWYLRRAARRIVVACSVVAVVGTIGFIKWQRTYPNDLRMTCLDVGHGQAIVMQSAGGTFLFDAGSQYNHNIGWRIVRPFLRYDGISEIDAIIVSHDDVDHINGIVEIVKNCNVHNVYASEAFTKKTSLKGTARYLANCLSEKGISLQPLPDSMNMNAPAPVKILWPDEAACENEALSDNETSVVSLVEFGGRRMLLCSDIEGFAQGQLAARCPDLRADVVVVPHHGSLRSGKAEFIGRFGAEHLVCSCGRSYFEGLQRKGSELTEKMLYTARDGAIFVCINGSGDVRVRTFNDN